MQPHMRQRSYDFTSRNCISSAFDSLAGVAVESEAETASCPLLSVPSSFLSNRQKCIWLKEHLFFRLSGTEIFDEL